MEKYGVNYESICRPTSIIEELKVLYKKHKADLIVMGMRGNSLQYKFLGSITVAAIREGELPVLAVPKNATFTSITKSYSHANILVWTPQINLLLLGKLHLLSNQKSRCLMLKIHSLFSTYEEPAEVKPAIQLDALLNNIWHEYKFFEDKKVIQGIESDVKEFKPNIF
ncbi:hypothetical protein BH23BAC2_BH23BAC2_04420 [soil metagenome]